MKKLFALLISGLFLTGCGSLPVPSPDAPRTSPSVEKALKDAIANPDEVTDEDAAATEDAMNDEADTMAEDEATVDAEIEELENLDL